MTKFLNKPKTKNSKSKPNASGKKSTFSKNNPIPAGKTFEKGKNNYQFDSSRRKITTEIANLDTVKHLAQTKPLISELLNPSYDFYAAPDFDIELEDFDRYAINLITLLQEAGYESYVVGGAVRDLLLNKIPKDCDLITKATPDQIRTLFPRLSRLIGRRFIIVHLIGQNNEIYECSTFRQDSNSDKIVTLEHDNNYGELHQDVGRRDFTVNCFYYDPKTQLIIDPFNGIKHLEEKRLVMIGDPKERFKQDPGRIIRAIRFSAKLDFTMDSEIEDQIRKSQDLLEKVPRMRLVDEFTKMMLSGHSSECYKLVKKFSLYKYFFPSLALQLEKDNSTEARYLEIGAIRSDHRVEQQLGLNPSFIHSLIYYPRFIQHLNTTLKQSNFDATIENLLNANQDSKTKAKVSSKSILRKTVNSFEQNIISFSNEAIANALANNEPQLTFYQKDFLEDIWLKQLQITTLIDHLIPNQDISFEMPKHLIKQCEKHDIDWLNLINSYYQFHKLRLKAKPFGFFNLEKDHNLTITLNNILNLCDSSCKTNNVKSLRRKIKELIEQDNNLKNMLIYLDRPSVRAAINLLDIQLEDLSIRFDVKIDFNSLNKVNTAWQLLVDTYNIVKEDVTKWSSDTGVYEFRKKP